MKSIELTPVSATKQLVVEREVIGYVDYQPEREVPWMGAHGSVFQYFYTKAEAVQFASTGVA